ncbi:alpha/beta fold hydrolase [uncultured Chitinophaga sp.]|jgi:Predicted hydrolase of the alpha/beta-hydrolase fold|uniref:YheT family hydrolase n=1 Tax=uncultured Chitinophaga sp. TaxID=339340 RepID=UPI00261557C1|nr:alpha/beta fold hydrolase [uncultured Chitinophaga sp.]
MPLIQQSDYKAPFFLKNRHLLTIYPTLFRKIRNADYQRVRISTADEDFLDLDFSYTDSDRIVIILHGLEGSADRKYVLGMVHIFNNGGYDTVSLNFRGCSGEPNKNLRFYHSGETGDLAQVVEYLAATGRYQSIHIVGFSLGGNVALKYLGEQGANVHPLIRSAVTLSVPCDLRTSSQELEKRHNSIYMQRFIRALGYKLELKARRFPDMIRLDNYHQVKTFRQFDDLYTAPIHGFKDALSYWAACSSRPFLKKICVPALLINALDDPFLSPECFPYEEAAQSRYFYLETPRYGGHVGFVTFGQQRYWSEKRAFAFINEHH